MLGGARDAAAGQDRPEQVGQAQSRTDLGLHGAHQVLDGGKGFHAHGAAHGDGAGPRHAAQIVAHQVHDHGVLGPLLGIRRQGFCGEPVLPRIARQGNAPLDGLGPDPLPPAGQEPLHAQGEEPEALQVQQGAEGWTGPPEGLQGQVHRVSGIDGIEGNAEVGHVEAAFQDALADRFHGDPVLGLGPAGPEIQGGWLGRSPGLEEGGPDLGVRGHLAPGPQLRCPVPEIQRLLDALPVLAQGAGGAILAGQRGFVAGQLE